jgi:hypothetical protein
MGVVDPSLAKKIYHETWTQTSFTTFRLLKKILDLTKTSLEGYIKDQTVLGSKKTVRDAINAAKPEELQDLWESATGTCTLFAINISKQSSCLVG